MKVTEEMRDLCPWLSDKTKTIAIADYHWWSAGTDKPMRKVRYNEAHLLSRSLEARHEAGIIEHPTLGDVYALTREG